jgi:hypothetical protein
MVWAESQFGFVITSQARILAAPKEMLMIYMIDIFLFEQTQ